MDQWLELRKPELDRLPQAENVLPQITQRYDGLLDAFRESVYANPSQECVSEFASRLWSHAVNDMRNGFADDRPLYWARLKGLNILQEAKASQHTRTFDTVSRGLVRALPTNSSPILVTGFDPFHLDKRVDQSNPSGIIALALDSNSFNGMKVHTAIFPVRFIDFDQGIAEWYFKNMASTNQLKMVVTCSMGRSRFDIERYALGRRTSDAPDNCRIVHADEITPLPGSIAVAEEEAEFVSSSLPRQSFGEGQDWGPWAIKQNHEIETQERGRFDAASFNQTTGQIGRQGSGGGFLSNEISYRSIRCVGSIYPEAQIGHIHVPRVEGFDEKTETAILQQFQAIFASLVQRLSRTS